MVWGHSVTCCPDATQVFAHVADVQPDVFGGVPRIWEKLKAALEAGIAAEPDAQAAAAGGARAGSQARRATGVGERRAELRPTESAPMRRRIRIRERLGLERCEWFMIGAAPAPLEVLEFFAAIGIPICEVWGMSETDVDRDHGAAAIELRLGTVGPPIPGVEVRLADDGELLVRGPIVMPGYRNQPERPPRRSTRTAGCTPATSARSTTTGS